MNHENRSESANNSRQEVGDPKKALLEEALQRSSKLDTAQVEANKDDFGDNGSAYKKALSEAVLRDKNMATSYDLTRLALSELKDSETFKGAGVAIYSERTEWLIDDLAYKIIWAIRRYYKKMPKFYAEGMGITNRIKALNELAENIDKSKTHQNKLKFIHMVIQRVHHGGGLEPGIIRDFEQCDWEEALGFLNRLGNLK